jgi:predicted MFS family arabinose efflux permease
VATGPVIVDLTTWRGRLLVPTLIFIALLASTVSSLGAPLLSSIAATFHVALVDSQWSLTLALLVGAVTLPVVGRLGTGRRRRGVLLANVAVMVAGCVVSALAPNFTVFLMGRGLQGCGVAMVPVAMSIARDFLPAGRTRRAVANLGVTTVVGVALGYPLTGLVSDRLGLRAAYGLAALVAGFGLLVCLLVVPSSRFQPAVRVDPVGAIALSAGIVGLILYLSEGERWGWRSVQEFGLLTGSVIVLAMLVRRDVRAANPVLDLRLMRNRVVLTTNLAAFLLGLGSFMLSTLFIRFAQTPSALGYGFGASGLVAGLLLVPMSALGFAGSMVVDRVGRVVGPHRILPLGAVLFGASMVAFAVARTRLWELFVEMGLIGLAVACSFPVLPRLTVRSVPSMLTSSALALNQVLRAVGTAAGSAITATILAAATPVGARYPSNNGYTAAALTSVAFFIVSGVVGLVLVSRSVFDAAAYESTPLPAEAVVTG